MIDCGSSCWAATMLDRLLAGKCIAYPFFLNTKNRQYYQAADDCKWQAESCNGINEGVGIFSASVRVCHGSSAALRPIDVSAVAADALLLSNEVTY